MKYGTGIAALLPVVFLVACVSAPKPIPKLDVQAPVIPTERDYLIDNHKNLISGTPISEWVSNYLDRGIPAVEALGLYQNKYVFISETGGSSLEALTMWSEGFLAYLDIPQLVADRVRRRFAGDGTRSPEEEYGRYHENLVRTAADAKYSWVKREDDFWIHKRFLAEENPGAEDGEYVFLILVTVDQTSLREHLGNLLVKALEKLELTRDQNSAIARFNQTFFDGF
ncbi:MAG: hypothetical protein LBT16_04865 [Treponema sp.]|jgi:hypothetical protein|nr:hypothetical protein [Treponema sp.]